MKVKLLSSILLMTNLIFAQSQLATIKKGPELIGSRKGSITSYLGMDDDAYYFSAYIKNDKLIERLDRNLDNPTSFIFEDKDPVTKEKYLLHSRIYFADKLYQFKMNTNKETKTQNLLAEEINKKTMVSKGHLKKIAEIQYEKNNNKGTYNLEPSPDERYLMVIENIPVEKEENEKFNVVMCDRDLNLVWKKDIELPYINSLFLHEDNFLDEEGNLYVLGKLYKDKVREKRNGEVNSSYHIIAYRNEASEKFDYELKLPEKYISSVTMSINNEGNIVCAGFYSKVSINSIDGSFFLTLDSKTKAVISSNYKEFDIEFMTEYMTEAQEKKAKKREDKGKDDEMMKYSLKKMIHRSDGGVLLVAEQYYITVSNSTNSSGQITTIYTYHYNDIIIVNIDPTGKIAWAKKIPKVQINSVNIGTVNLGMFSGPFSAGVAVTSTLIGTNSPYSSYALTVTNKMLYFIYNDHIDNLDIEKTKRLKNFTVGDRKGVVVLASMDYSGKLKREILISNKELEVAIRPAVCEQIDENQLMIFGEVGKLEQFGIVTFQ